MIYVIDSVMGSGKTCAAIQYMKEHPSSHFFYVTPFLEEATRIYEACPELNFIEPRRETEFHGSKVSHIYSLICDGYNICTTHQAFRRFPPDMLDKIRDLDYILILDECIDVLEESDVCQEDIEMMITCGFVEEYSPGRYRVTKKEYKGEGLKKQYETLCSRELVGVVGKQKNTMLFCWRLPPELFLSFRYVYVLTYMFEANNLHHMFQINGIRYQYKYVSYDGETYRFCDQDGYIPNYVYTVWDNVTVLEHSKLNDIGDKKYALSESWFNKPGSDTEQLKNNLVNYFKQIAKADSANRLWGTFSSAVGALRGNGYSKRHLAFNSRSTNKYAHATALAYCANVFMNVGQKLYYQQNGAVVDEDAYALSTMVQWVWRSAIRNGGKIQIYIPSKRMRTLFCEWLDSLEELNPDKETVRKRKEAREKADGNYKSKQELRWVRWHEERVAAGLEVVPKRNPGGKKSKVKTSGNDPAEYEKTINGGLRLIG